MGETGRQSEIDAEPAEISDEELLVTYLKGHDALCPLCGYNLRHLTIPRCPECGREIKITVGLAEQYLAPLVCLLIFLILPAGMGLIACVAAVASGFQIYEFDSIGRMLMTFDLIGFQLSIIPPILAIFFRRRFLRLSRRAQWIVAGVVAAEPLALFGMLIVLMALGE